MIQMPTFLQILPIIQQELINLIIIYVTVIVPYMIVDRHVRTPFQYYTYNVLTQTVQKTRPRVQHFFIFGISRVQISAGESTILTNFFFVLSSVSLGMLGEYPNLRHVLFLPYIFQFVAN
jgi:hypothetical protein